MTVRLDDRFEHLLAKIKDRAMRGRVKQQMLKIIKRPDVGKPMRYVRKGTREVYIPPYRLSYLWIEEEDVVVFLDLYHKDGQ